MEMKFTVDIPASQFRQLKERAKSEDASVEELILCGVKELLKESRRNSRQRERPPIVSSKRPQTVHLDNERIYELIFPTDTEMRIEEGLDDVRQGNVFGPFRSASAMSLSLRQGKKPKSQV